ncbi:cysteine-rich repeat secretory protein 15-like isoform X1 [Hibiscus syriacus]|uniref:Cysteine-rich repeat secretory protein 15-like isoform X1 n=1 Tax=Hibiscus syriacus TaxID=106335 RepID=A0A6A3A6A2_HIBSY|nr:auxin-responsive protein SAUR36-like [Hibiscus syriacus]KAE8699718.1 cysteine-rich repeat secretory protein 15-like isoform X1 [Hibiscus syriacus]
MRKIRGFKIGKKLVRISGRFIGKSRCPRGCRPLTQPGSFCNSNPFSKLITWGRRLTQAAKSLCSVKPGSGYVPVKEEVQKGRLAVYLGKKGGDFHRVLVPVIYFNHPLFGELLRGAEEEYGFSQQGGITIPCGFSEFERVRTRIAARTGRWKMSWKRHL